MSNDFTKVCRIGTIPNGRGRMSVFVKIEYSAGNLSITGVEGPNTSGGASGSCGQINAGYKHRNIEQNDKRSLKRATEFKFAPGWGISRWYDLLDVWAKWHLNDMSAGCEHQQALGWDSYSAHPSEPCPTCGYNYGTAWHRTTVPAEVVEFLVKLPDADRKPAWA